MALHRILSGSTLVLILLCTQADGKSMYNRWAIIASPDVQKSGLADLLTVELSKVDGIELVERERLDAATKELELIALFGAKGAGKRLKLGRTLGADALLLLSFEKREKKQFVKVIVADCRYGARLRVDFLPHENDARDELAAKCRPIVAEVRRHFAGGIKQIIGVTPFVSRNLTHDYDHLQAGYACLLENALWIQPGVAVLETEEARAIGQELQHTGAKLKGRVVPLFVEGEFKMSTAKPGDKPKVQMTLSLVDAQHGRQRYEQPTLSFEGVTDLLTRRAPEGILRRAKIGPQKPLTRPQQARLLADRAEVFSLVGARNHSIGLYEAALLLTPDDVKMRLRLIRDYRMRKYTDARNLARQARDPRARAHLKEAQEKQRLQGIADWRALSEHAFEAVRSRELNPLEAGILMYGILEGIPRTAENREMIDGFFWKVFALFPSLDPKVGNGGLRSWANCSLPYELRYRTLPPAPPERQYYCWTGTACSYLTWRAVASTGGSGGTRTPWGKYYSLGRPKFFDDPDTLDDLYRFLTEIASQGEPPIPFMASILAVVPSERGQLFNQGRFSEQQIRAFYDRLLKTNQHANVFYARCGLLTLDWARTAKEDRLRKIESLLRSIEGEPTGRRGFHEALAKLEKRTREELGMVKPTLHKRHRVPFRAVANTDAPPQVRFELVPGIETNRWGDVTRCTDTLDLIRHGWGVFVMTEPGVVRPLVKQDAETGRVFTACFDGQNIWVPTEKSGIHVVSPQGKLVGKIGEDQGLPAHERSLTLHPIQPGRCLAVGSTGKHGRLWYAIVSPKGNAPGAPWQVNVFHTATKIPEPQEPSSQDDPEMIFRLSWRAECSDPSKPRERLLLIGRDDRHRRNLRPLAVNLTAPKVSIYPVHVPVTNVGASFRLSQTLHCMKGRFLQAQHSQIALLSPPEGQDEIAWTTKTIVPWGGHKLLYHDGVLYSPGSYWVRIDPDTLQYERLNRAPLPPEHSFCQYGVSAHYGLIAWESHAELARYGSKKKLYRVIVDPNAPPRFVNVPAEFRKQHQLAVDAIRESGGLVDAANNDPAVGTRVAIPMQWKAGDEGLAHLKDIYNLCALYLFRLMTNDSLAYLKPLKDLRVLNICENQVTDKGLVHVQGLRNLTELRLEGNVDGKEFTDAGLKTLKGLSQLKNLTLYGEGFTDAGLKALDHFPQLKKLVLYDTAITSAALAELEKRRPGLEVENHPPPLGGRRGIHGGHRGGAQGRSQESIRDLP